jgi:hypothetical protein
MAHPHYHDAMTLSLYARKPGASYCTAWRWFKVGKLAAYQADTGTIITDPIGVAVPTGTQNRRSQAEFVCLWCG